MVTDQIYSEFGYDREAIKAAINNKNIYEDPDFADIIRRMDSIRNSSFLNI
jgi:hypothetical protein